MLRADKHGMTSFTIDCFAVARNDKERVTIGLIGGIGLMGWIDERWTGFPFARE